MTSTGSDSAVFPRGAIDVRAVAQRRTMIVLILTQVVGTVGVGVAPSIGVLLAGEITQNEAWAGLARTGSTLGAALFGLPLGALAARYGRRVALSAGWWIAAAGSAVLVLAAQAGMVGALFVGLLLIGAGSAVSLQARFAATDLATLDARGRSLALVVWVGTIGTVLGPNLGIPGAIVGAWWGLDAYAGAFLIAAICFAAAGLIIAVMLRPDPLVLLRSIAADPAPSGASPRIGMGTRLRGLVASVRASSGVRYAVLAILTAQIVMVAVMTMTPVHLVHEGGSLTIVGVTISLHILGMYAFAPLVGLLVDRRGGRTAVAVGIGVLLTSLGVGVFAADSTVWIVASLVLLGIGWSFVNVAGSSLFSAAVSSESRASAQGGVDALANLCGALAAFASGPIMAAGDFRSLSIVAGLALLPLIAMTVARVPLRASRLG